MKHLKSFNEFSAISIHGEMLNVGDADAITLTLKRQQETFLVIIDGGDTSSRDRVLDHVKTACSRLQKDGPDLIICTHYDSDHIAGLIALADHFGEKIREIWMHRPPKVMRESGQLLTEISEQRSAGKPLSPSASFLNNLRLLSRDPNGRFDLLLESIKQANDLITLASKKKIPIKEPFAHECSHPDWPEIKILGPTRAFFQGLFTHSIINELISSEYLFFLNEGNLSGTVRAGYPCSRLEKNPNTSAINRASVILRIDIGPKKLLFTGDAGIQSFQAVAGYPESIQEMSFLKIPHHGSRHNITNTLIDTINPAYAYNSGNIYEDPDVMECLNSKKERTVLTTKDGDDLTFSF
jgi:beta-lactamase superfamily II metal-dependent hydrolase